MNLVKRILRRDHDHDHGNGGTALAKRERSGGAGGLSGRKDVLRFDRDGFNQLWRDFERDPWSLVREPWSVFDRMSERLNTLANWPAVDVSEDEHAGTVRYDVPGLDANDLNVQVSGNLLTVSGRREDEWADERRQRGVRRRERVSGSFSRTVTLPSYVDPAKVEARYDKGTLTVTAPKTPGKGPRRVAVKVA